jgi:hypothetical protein
MLIIPYAFEAFIFSNHFNGRIRSVDVQFHLLLALTIYGCVIFCTLESLYQREVLFTYGRVLFTALQGTWFLQIAFALYLPFNIPALKWNVEDSTQVPNVTFFYCMHFFVLFILLFVELWLVNVIYWKRCWPPSPSPLSLRPKRYVIDVEKESNVDDDDDDENLDLIIYQKEF